MIEYLYNKRYKNEKILGGNKMKNKKVDIYLTDEEINNVIFETKEYFEEVNNTYNTFLTKNFNIENDVFFWASAKNQNIFYDYYNTIISIKNYLNHKITKLQKNKNIEEIKKLLQKIREIEKIEKEKKELEKYFKNYEKLEDFKYLYENLK